MRLIWPPAAAGGEPLDHAGLADLYRLRSGERCLRTNFVSTLDGSAQGPDGRSGSINTPADRWLFGMLRAMTDLVLVGAGTVRAEHYQAVELSKAQAAFRAELGLEGVPTLAIVSRSLRLDPAIVTSGGGPVIVIAGIAGDARTLTDAGVEVLRSPGPGGVDVAMALSLLAERGLMRVLCEGGPSLHRQLFADGLVDEVCLTLTGDVVGGLGRRITDGPRVQASLSPAHIVIDDDGTLLTRWTRG